MTYSTRYGTPSPLFPTPSPTSLERLIETWEILRKLDVEGYRTSYARPMSTWLVDIKWADGRSVRSPGRGTTCSPFVTQSVAMAYTPRQLQASADDASSSFAPVLATGEPLSFLFSRAANGTLSPAHKRLMDRYGMTLADNEWPRPIIFFNMGFAVEPTQLRRGDAVHIDWMSGGGHAVFCWDVHLNERGEVDAFQYVSSNGRIRVNGTSDGAGLGVSIGGTPSGSDGLIRQCSVDPIRYEARRAPLFVDDERHVAECAWVTWNPHLKPSDLVGCRTRPRGRLSYARVVKAARFHGVVPPPPFAMASGGAVVQAATPVMHDECEDIRLVQKQLKLLRAAGFIAADPGEPDGKSGRLTRAAIRTFQSDYHLQADGIAGPRTCEKLREVYQAACLSPAGKEYLATGAVSPRGVDDGGLSFAAEAPRVCDLYFRHGAARPGTQVEVILEAEGLDGEPLALYLRDVQSGVRYDIPERLHCEHGRAAALLRLPEALAARGPQRIVAGIPALGTETALPLTLCP